MGAGRDVGINLRSHPGMQRPTELAITKCRFRGFRRDRATRLPHDVECVFGCGSDYV